MDKRKKTNNDLQNSTHKANDQDTRTPLKTRGELRCTGGISSSYFTSGTRHVNLVTNPVINHEWGMDRKVFSTD
jgi:hypothetical protein